MVLLEFKKNQNTDKLAVALCGTMWHYIYVLFFQKTKKNDGFTGFFLKNQNTDNLAVALCGTMWHYIYVLFFFQKIREMMGFKEIEKNNKILYIWLWHYVALCGSIFMYVFPKRNRNDDF